METVLSPDCNKEMLSRYVDWKTKEDQLMKKIVLKATEKELKDFIWKLKDVWTCLIFDKGLTQIPENSFTSIIIEPLEEEKCNEFFKHLKLL